MMSRQEVEEAVQVELQLASASYLKVGSTQLACLLAVVGISLSRAAVVCTLPRARYALIARAMSHSKSAYGSTSVSKQSTICLAKYLYNVCKWNTALACSWYSHDSRKLSGCEIWRTPALPALRESIRKLVNAHST
jgi:hypothetical protein